jgi:hypothetical protein
MNGLGSLIPAAVKRKNALHTAHHLIDTHRLLW